MPSNESFRRALSETLDNLAARSDVFSDLAGGARLARLWDGFDGYSRHVRRRIDDGSVTNAEELAARVFGVLADVSTVEMALTDTARFTRSQFSARVGNWVVLIDRNGRIVTAYPSTAGELRFAQWNRRYDHPVRTVALAAEDRALLARLFAEH